MARKPKSSRDVITTEHLVIGGRGLVGSALCAELARRKRNYIATTRRRDAVGGRMIHLDLLAYANAPRPCAEYRLPSAEVLYLVAAIKPAAPFSWQVNVDATIRLAQRYRHQCVVFISSDAVEWSGNAYARQKAQVESFIQSIAGTIIRPARVVPERVAEFARLLADAGEQRLPGVIRWK